MGSSHMPAILNSKTQSKMRNRLAQSNCHLEAAPRMTRALSCGIIGAGLLAAIPAQAGGTINFGPDQSISVGFGIRTHFQSVEDDSPDKQHRSKDFDLEDLRLYINGSLNKYIKGTFNANKKNDNSMQVMDAIAQFEPSDAFNVWMGRMLPPSDRANLAGPFYAMAWNYPVVVSQYPSYAVGRDDGLMAWGKVADNKLLYSIGAFEGHNNQPTASSESDNLLYAGRLAINILDPEPAPAYYEGTTYFGGFNIFTIGLVFQHQADGVGSAADKGDYNAYNVDVLYETKDTGSGSLTLEGAYYHYDSDDTVDIAYGSAGTNTGGITQGKAYLASVAYLFPQTVGWGKLQPYVRYQKFEGDKITNNGVVELYDSDTKQLDVGINYVIAGPNAKISLTYFDVDADSGAPNTDSDSTNGIILGVQLQF